mgnify:CR=1 FL=1
MAAHHLFEITVVKHCETCHAPFDVQGMVAPRVHYCPYCRKDRDAAQVRHRRMVPADDGTGPDVPIMMAVSMSDRTWNGKTFYQARA